MAQFIGKNLEELPTPAFCVDKKRFIANCEKMLITCKELGVNLRGHTKTHKTLEGAILQTGGSKKCIVVSTLVEAELYGNNGFDDILYGYPLSPDKIQWCQKLCKQLNNFHVLVDNDLIVRHLAENAPQNSKWSVMLAVDCGNKREGVWWENEFGIELVKKIHSSPNLNFSGIYVHCGNSYKQKSENKTVTEIPTEASERAANFVNRLKKNGIECKTFGIGSTPSCSNPVPQMSHLSELHPGNYVFYDVQQLSLGSCTLEEIACKVATRVIGHYPQRNEILIDCGFTGLTLQGIQNSESGTRSAIFEGNDNLRIVTMTQEIGKVTTINGSSLDYSAFPLGSVLFLYPWHSCATASMYECYFVHEKSVVTEIWRPCRGWLPPEA